MWMLLGIGSGLSWGVADFFGGLQSRRLPALAVSFWSQVAGALALIMVLLAGGERPVLASVGWGAVAGVFGGLALVCFYRGLAVGTMSIVAPISACGATVPVVLSLIQGVPLSMLAAAGILATLAGIVLVSLAPGHAEATAPASKAAIPLALGAALGFGCFYVFLDRGSAVAGAMPLWVVGGARAGSLTMLVLLILAGRRSAPWPGRRIGAIAAIGFLDTTANVLFSYASILA
jgi:drug/metabolite transporter (DMT)-like permease